MTSLQTTPQPPHELGSRPSVSGVSNSAATVPQDPPPTQQTNYGSPIPGSMVTWLRPTSPDAPLEELRKRYQHDGYLWLKKVLPTDEVLDMRESYFEKITTSTPILAPGTSAREGIFDTSLDPMRHQGLGATPDKSEEDILDAIHKDDRYRRLINHPKLRGAVRRVMGWEKEILMERGLIRHNVPSSKAPSGIHYDQLFLRAGDPVFVSVWVPIGDCSADGGGLMYLEDSLALGEKIEERFKERQERDDMSQEERISAFNKHMGEFGHLSHNAEEWAKEDGLGKRWMVANYEAGDAVFHSPWIIHSSSKNTDDKARIRLSTDLRFYEEGANFDERWAHSPFFHGDGL